MSIKAERWILLVSFVATSISGIALHKAGHCLDHELWHAWAIVHVGSSLIWFLATIKHVHRHIKWYRKILSVGIKRRSLMTCLLTTIFSIVVITGIILLVGVDGENSPLGVWHYKFGLVLILFSIIHVLKRKKSFRIRSPKC